jgi:hypothetical protein
MANANSVAYQKTQNVPVDHVSPDEWGGRVRRMYFEVTVPTSGIGDTMTLGYIPAGARVCGGSFAFSAAQGATATTAIGIAGTTGKYRAAAVTNATTPFRIADSVADNLGSKTTARELVIATNAAATWTAGSFKGYIDYVVD